MNKKEKETFDNMLEEIKTLIPNVEIRNQPMFSRNKIQNFERKYKLNTEDILKENLTEDEHIDLHFEGKNYEKTIKNQKVPLKDLESWLNHYSIFKIHKGNINEINLNKNIH